MAKEVKCTRRLTDIYTRYEEELNGKTSFIIFNCYAFSVYHETEMLGIVYGLYWQTYSKEEESDYNNRWAILEEFHNLAKSSSSNENEGEKQANIHRAVKRRAKYAKSWVSNYAIDEPALGNINLQKFEQVIEELKKSNEKVKDFLRIFDEPELIGYLYKVWKESKTLEDPVIEQIRKIYPNLNNLIKGSFRISKESLNDLKSESIPDDCLEKLATLVNKKLDKDKKEVKGEYKFLKILEDTIGTEQTNKYKSLILKHALIKDGNNKVKPGFHEKPDFSKKSIFVEIRCKEEKIPLGLDVMLLAGYPPIPKDLLEVNKDENSPKSSIKKKPKQS